MSKVDSHASQPIPVIPASVAPGDALHADAVPPQGSYNDHVTVGLAEYLSEAAVPAGVSETPPMVELDAEDPDGQGDVTQGLMTVRVRMRDVEQAPSSSRLDALKSHMAHCIGGDRTCSRDLHAFVGFSTAVTGAGIIGLSRLAPSPYKWIIGGAGVSVFLAGATVVKYAADRQ